MAEPRPSLVLPAILIVLVLVGAGVGIGLLYFHNHPASPGPIQTVAIGDNVTVNYIGTFGSGPQAGRVFDTSFYSVATSNLTYPKSLEFTFRGSASSYTPLPVHVGATGSFTIGNLTFGSVVTGFWQGLVGLPVNHTRSITVPPNLGYGPVIENCSVTRPLAFTVPVLVAVTPAGFSTAYPGKSSAAGTEFADPSFGWTDLVLSNNSTGIVIENLPTAGFSVPSSSWPIVVTAVNSTVITLSNQLTPANAGVTLGTAASATVCGSHRFIVTSVNLNNGTFTELYDFSSAGGGVVNAEIQGQTLVFQVTVVRFY
jgi:FKBP-type peptidyl-prolyl cis-trans isomerase